MALREFLVVLHEHQARLDRLVDRRAIPELRKLYDAANAELDRKLSSLTRATRGDTFTAHQMRMLKAQVRQAQVVLSRRMAGALGGVTTEAQLEALRGFARDIALLERRFTGSEITVPVEEAARFRGVIDRRKTSLLRIHTDSFARYGAASVRKIEQEMSVSLATGETTAEAVDRVVAAHSMEFWQAERIARTETAWAFNSTASDGIEDAAEEFPDLMKRWTEYVEDGSYAPMDDRVGVDSIAMHAQITDAAGVFTMPPTAPHADADGNTVVSHSLVGKSWEYPPNRPNDRATVMPWRPHWGIPGWRYRGGRRVPVR